MRTFLTILGIALLLILVVLLLGFVIPSLISARSNELVLFGGLLIALPIVGVGFYIVKWIKGE